MGRTTTHTTLKNYTSPSLTELEAEKVAACSVSGDAGEELAIFIIYRGELEKFPPLISEVRRVLSQEAGIDAAQIIPLSSFPKTTSGKVQCFLLAEQFAAGDFEDKITQLKKTAQITSSNNIPSALEQSLLNICNTIITDKEIGVNDNLFEIGTSSLNLTHIHERIDELFPEQVELTDLFDYPTVSELAEFLEPKNLS